MRLTMSDAGDATGDTLATVRDIVLSLLRLENCVVEPMPPLRPAVDMMVCFLNARRATPMWHTTPNGSAYQLQDICPLICLPHHT